MFRSFLLLPTASLRLPLSPASVVAPRPRATHARERMGRTGLWGAGALLRAGLCRAPLSYLCAETFNEIYKLIRSTKGKRYLPCFGFFLMKTPNNLCSDFAPS